MQSTVKTIREALVAAKSAVRADEEQNFKLARTCYLRAVELLAAERPNVPEQHRTVVLAHITAYETRLQELELEAESSAKGQCPRQREQKMSRLVFKELALPTLADAYEPHPTVAESWPFWQMRVWRRTMLGGAYITPQLYVPQTVWVQTDAKFNGVHAKISALQQLAAALQTLQSVPPPPKSSEQGNRPGKLSRSFSSVFFTEALPLRTALNDFGGELHKIQNQLAMAFPFIDERGERDRTRMMSTIRKRSSRKPSASEELSKDKQKNKAVQNISKAAKTFGKMVKKRVNTVVERAGAAVPSRIGGTELETYTQLLCTVFDQCQFIGTSRICGISLLVFVYTQCFQCFLLSNN
jgi:hypothetical protein